MGAGGGNFNDPPHLLLLTFCECLGFVGEGVLYKLFPPHLQQSDETDKLKGDFARRTL
jgi:hypothetical protein